MKRSPLARYWHRQRVAAGNAMRRVAGMRFRPLGLLAPIALIATLPLPAMAREPVSTNATVSAADPRAAAAGQEILRKGGSATDAAIAMMLTLNVVEPHNSGIGGGGFLMHHDGQSGVLESIDGRETAPAAARPAHARAPAAGGRTHIAKRVGTASRSLARPAEGYQLWYLSSLGASHGECNFIVHPPGARRGRARAGGAAYCGRAKEYITHRAVRRGGSRVEWRG